MHLFQVMLRFDAREGGGGRGGVEEGGWRSGGVEVEGGWDEKQKGERERTGMAHPS